MLHGENTKPEERSSLPITLFTVALFCRNLLQQISVWDEIMLPGEGYPTPKKKTKMAQEM